MWRCGKINRRRECFLGNRNINSRRMKRTAKRMYSPEELIMIADKKNKKTQAANKIEFDRALMNAFKEQFHVDIWLKAGDQTDAIPAHKLILMARSKVFRNLLESDDLKASLSKETITLTEMTHDELETFLEFMYNRSLPDTKLVQHVRILYFAADKYEIPHLQDLCRNQLTGSMNTRNVYDVLEIAKIHSDKILQHEVYKFIASHMEGISSSRKFMSFVESDPALTVQAIRGHVNKQKRKRQEEKKFECAKEQLQLKIESGLTQK